MPLNREPDLVELRATVNRLAAENAMLRDQLRAVASGLPVVLADTPVTKRAPASPRRRRWMGNAIGALLVALGFAFGALFVSRKAPEFRRGYDDGAAAARAAKGEPLASPTPIAPAAPNATAPPPAPVP